MEHTVRYRFGRDEYIALIRAHRSNGLLGRLGPWGRYTCFSLFFVVLINLFNYETWSNDPVIAFIVSAIAFAIFIIVAPVGEFIAERGLARWMFPRLSVAGKDCVVEFGDDGIRSQYGGIEGRIPWRSVTRILETDEYFFLAISRAEMLPVPKRALPSRDAMTELGHYIRSRADAAAIG